MYSALVVLGVGVSLSAAQNYPLTTDSECDCYMAPSTHEDTPFYYDLHKYWDFTDKGSYASSSPPSAPDDEADAVGASTTNDYLGGTAFQADWQISAWTNENTKLEDEKLMAMTPRNVYFENENNGQTYLALRTSSHGSFQSSAEIQTRVTDFKFLSMRMEARTIGDPGACTAMFTYGKGGEQESDVEFLTIEDSNMVHLTNQPSLGDERATRKMELNGFSYNNWHWYRMDWTEDYVSWYIDDDRVHNSTFQVPDSGLDLFFNSWGNGGRWTGTMEDGGEAFLHIRHIEFIANTTSTGGQGTGCHSVCSIDHTSKTGTPVLLNQGKHFKSSSS